MPRPDKADYLASGDLFGNSGYWLRLGGVAMIISDDILRDRYNNTSSEINGLLDGFLRKVNEKK